MNNVLKMSKDEFKYLYDHIWANGFEINGRDPKKRRVQRLRDFATLQLANVL